MADTGIPCCARVDHSSPPPIVRFLPFPPSLTSRQRQGAPLLTGMVISRYIPMPIGREFETGRSWRRIPAHVIEDQATFSTRSFLIRYCEDRDACAGERRGSPAGLTGVLRGVPMSQHLVKTSVEPRAPLGLQPPPCRGLVEPPKIEGRQGLEPSPRSVFSSVRAMC